MKPSIIKLSCLFGCAVSGYAAASGTPAMPFSFVENRGQASSKIRYIGNGPEFKAWFYDQSVALQQGHAVTRLHFEGGSANPQIEPANPMGSTANYLRGSDPRGWQRDLPLFASIEYRGVWPGIDVRFKAEKARSKTEYVVAAGASVDEIRLRFEGEPKIEADGGLVVSNATGKFHEDKPFLFQDEGADRREVAGSFHLLPGGKVGFSVAAYDHTKPLVIDPTILFSGYFGGSSQSTITAVAVNSFYNTVVAGWTIGTDLPASSGAKPHNSGGVDAFVAAFSPAGGTLLYCTYLGGSGDDRALGIAVDSANNTYVTGQTSSPNFPVLGGLQTKLKGTRDAFVVKLNAAGNALIYSTYLGGTGVDVGNAVVVDASNSAVIIGDTNSTNLPVTAGTFQPVLAGGQDAFVAKLSPDGAGITWLTYFGGSATEHGAALKQDAAGTVLIGGSTYSTNLPIAMACQPRSGGGQDGFVARLTADGKSLMLSTYMGGSNGSPGAPESVNAVSFGASGFPLFAGTTSSYDFPITVGAFQPVFGGGTTDGFIGRISPTSGALARTTFLGGSGDDGITSMVSDMNSWIYITGYTASLDFPTLNPIQASNAGGFDAFFTKMTFDHLLNSTYLGGAGNDSGNAIAIDSMTSAVVAGSTGSGNFPLIGNVGRSLGSALSSFVTKLAPNFTLATANMPALLFDVWHNTGFNGPNVTLNTATFGVAGDVPFYADWDGSGVKRLGVFRAGTWIVDSNGNGTIDPSDRRVAFGIAGDLPVVGDWNGTGRLKLGLFRQGTFILDLSGHLAGTPTGLSDLSFSFGQAGDIPVVADWNAGGSTKVGVFRNGQWLIDYNGDHAFNSLDKTYTYGQAGDVPVTGDWNSAGIANKIGVYRHGYWILNVAGQNQMVGTGQYELYLGFGGVNYTPLVY